MARALAIAVVVLAHSHQKLMDFGGFGVELFFALSGYLIGSILYRCVPEKGPWRLLGVVNFWQRRWWRTLPNYYLFLLIAIVFYSLRSEMPETGWKGLLPYFLFMPNLMQPNEAFFDISWSLCVEEAFYFLYPLLLLGVGWLRISRGRAFVITVLMLILVAPVLREIVMQTWPASQARVATLPRLDAIGYGVAMAVWQQTKGVSAGASKWMAVIGMALVAAVGVLYGRLGSGQDARIFFHIALIAAPLGFSLCMPLLASWKSVPNWVSWLGKPVTAISLWSYSIYLCHHMVILGVIPLFGEERGMMAKLMSKLLGIFLAVLLSWLVFRFYESPMTRRRPPEQHYSGGWV